MRSSSSRHDGGAQVHGSHTRPASTGVASRTHARPTHDAQTSASAASVQAASSASPAAAAPVPVDVLADQWADWITRTMAEESKMLGLRITRSDVAADSEDAEHDATRMTARDLVPLLRGRMLRTVPLLVERVRPAAEARIIARNVRLAEAQRAATAGGPDDAQPPAPQHPRQAQLDALRAKRAALQRSVAAKRESLQSVETDVARSRLALHAEADALQAARQARDVDMQRRVLRQAFVADKRQTQAVWAEYAARIRRQAMLPDENAQTAGQTQSQQQQQSQSKYFTNGHTGQNGANGASDSEVESSSQRALRAAFAVVLQSFESTFEQAQRDALDRAQDEQTEQRAGASAGLEPPPFPKLTPEWCAARAELRALFPVNGATTTNTGSAAASSPNSAFDGARFDAQSFLRELGAEVERSMAQIQRKRQAVEEQNRATPAGSDSNGSTTIPNPADVPGLLGAAPAAGTPSRVGAATAPPSLQSLLSGLIGTLQEESATRFLQAQKLQNESAASEQILAELMAKQRASDSDPSSSLSFEQQQSLGTMRRLQNLQQQLAALRAQLAFASKTHATFSAIRDARRQAWAEFEAKKAAVDAFPSVRKRMERCMIDLVLQNKIMRKKFDDYNSRVSEYASSQLHPLCALLADVSSALVESVAREAGEGSGALVSPLSLVSGSRASGGAGRIPVDRLGIHLVQTPTLQLNQLHALLVDPFGGVGAPGSFKGLAAFPLHQNPTQILAYMQRLAHNALHASLVERGSVLSFQHLLSPRGPGQGGVVVCGVDVSLLAEWQRVERRQSVSSDASSLLRVSLPRLSQLLHSLVREPAQTLIPHLRNRLGYNIDDYVQQIRNIATQIVQQQQRYDRLLKQRQ